jgi:hypothetical protein
MAEKEPKAENKDAHWLKLALEADASSTSFFDNNYRKKIEDSERHFQSKHHSASKYNKSMYRYRSKRFIPKTRSSIRNNEAAAAQAFFSNMDVVSLEPYDQENPMQLASSDVMKAILDYRFQNSIRGFKSL